MQNNKELAYLYTKLKDKNHTHPSGLMYLSEGLYLDSDGNIIDADSINTYLH